MKKKDLLNLGVPESCIGPAIECVKNAGKKGFFHGKTAKSVLRHIVDDPDKFSQDEYFAPFATALLAERIEPPAPKEPIPFKQWGTDIEPAAIEQMRDVCRIPQARYAAVMADSHLGYSMPIGGVLALEDTIFPMGVGVDISCSVCLSIVDKDPKTLVDVFGGKQAENYVDSLFKGTRFGIGASWKPHLNHPVMDKDWNITSITKSLKDKALQQLGTSGSGNHYCSVCLLRVENTIEINGTKFAPGEYVAIHSHSGSRGTGAAICSYYDKVARNKVRKGEFACLDMNSEAGQEYWLAMNLMHDYTRANHELIHKNVSQLIGTELLTTIFHSHNLAWVEEHYGQKLYVHRKGATPAESGSKGIIAGTMADPSFLVLGKGNPESLKSASHGAGRRMSRTQAIKTFNWNVWKSKLKQRQVRLLAGGLDEVPDAYKNIFEVMRAQQDLVEILAEIHPKIVLMSDDGKRED